MIELDGIQYNVRTPRENTQDMLAYVNKYCQDNDIRNSEGELVQIEDNYANPLYELLHGFGYMSSTIQKLLYNAACSLNLARASDRQLMNIAEIAHVQRKKATKTTIPVMIYSSLVTDPNAQPCVITTALSVTYVIGGTTLVFHPAYDATIPVGSSLYTLLICETIGSYSIPADAITSFDTNPEGFRTMVSSASVPGQDEESIADLRLRIQERSISTTQLDRAADAISQLDGVSLCNIYFNYSNVNDVIIGGITVPPRQALLFVQGFSNDIAKTFYNYLCCNTAGSDYTYAVEQDYITHTGQALPVYIIPPTVVYLHFIVHVGTTILDTTKQGIKDAICALSSSLTIGQNVTSTMVINKIQESYPEIQLQGVEISLTGETGDYSYKAVPQPQQLFGFKIDYILIDEAV